MARQSFPGRENTLPRLPRTAGRPERSGEERDENQDGPLAQSGVGTCCNSHTSHEQGSDAVPFGQLSQLLC